MEVGKGDKGPQIRGRESETAEQAPTALKTRGQMDSLASKACSS